MAKAGDKRRLQENKAFLFKLQIAIVTSIVSQMGGD